MRYLIDKDYNKVLAPEDREILTYQDEDWTIQGAEATAVERVKAYLRSYPRAQYDLSAIIIPIQPYDAATTYQAGAHVVYESQGATLIYVAIQATTGNAPTDIAYWGLGDNRNPLLVTAMVDLVVYDLFSHIMPDNVPALRERRYKEAVKLLEMIRGGEMDLALPTLPDPDNINDRFSSNPRRKWYF